MYAMADDSDLDEGHDAADTAAEAAGLFGAPNPFHGAANAAAAAAAAAAGGAPPGLPPGGGNFVAHVPHERGLDAGLSKACPDTGDLSESTYRRYRRRIEVFSRMCRRRGPGTASALQEKLGTGRED